MDPFYLLKAMLVLILGNQNAQIWEISFDKINLEMILPLVPNHSDPKASKHYCKLCSNYAKKLGLSFLFLDSAHRVRGLLAPKKSFLLFQKKS